jgi:hypothetical protein
LVFPEDKNLVEVVPWKFISARDAKPPHYSWGRVPVSKEEAENYDVILGSKKCAEVFRKKANTQSEKVKFLGAFAVEIVVSQGYCKEAEIPEDSKYILGWEGSSKCGIKVRCKK